ncbi:hypothetical protein GCM10027569_21410 [Flindersiella endophytica]
MASEWVSSRPSVGSICGVVGPAQVADVEGVGRVDVSVPQDASPANVTTVASSGTQQALTRAPDIG